MIQFGNPDCVLAFPGGTGTADMVQKATKADIPVIVHGQAREARP
jgi:hypothetical protein